MIVYPKAGVPYPFKFPYEEHIIILGMLVFPFGFEFSVLCSCMFSI